MSCKTTDAAFFIWRERAARAMGRYAQLVVGPAGSGKVRTQAGLVFPAHPCGCSLRSLRQSTYCQQLHAHCESVGRVVHVVNLDPAAEHFEYALAGDVRELVSLEVRHRATALRALRVTRESGQDVMEELELGPNGGLLYCMEYLVRASCVERPASVFSLTCCAGGARRRVAARRA